MRRSTALVGGDKGIPVSPPDGIGNAETRNNAKTMQGIAALYSWRIESPEHMLKAPSLSIPITWDTPEMGMRVLSIYKSVL
jgi:hypothetical protein